MQDELDENNLSSCLICKSTENLVSTDDIDDNTVTWRQKLSYLLPELDWAIILKLCSNCRGELDKVCFFRNKCINSYIKTVASIDYPKNNEMLNFTPELIKYNENFECSDCKITFNNITNLINHKKSHFHSCNVCAVTFMNKIDLDNHSTLRHTLESTVKFPSENSSEIKIEPTEIFLHCEINYDETEIKEKELSGDEANSSTEVDETCDSETNKINYYGCEQCELSFKKNCLLKQHVLKVHTDKKFICDICEGKFSTQGYLNSHMKFHIGIRSHTCSFCGKGFINGSDLRHHEKIHTNKRAYKCDKCSKGFNTASILQKHIMVVHTDRSLWKYVCSHCDKRFPLKIGLDQHTKIHTGERDHECQFCSKKFITNNKLQIHLKSHSNVAEFECHLCGQKYKHQRHLKDHMARVHSIGDAKIPTRNKVKKHFCHICPKSYFANNKLQKHIRSHTGEKPFQCSICDKSFTDNTYKKYHLKTVHNVIEEENVLN